MRDERLDVNLSGSNELESSGIRVRVPEHAADVHFAKTSLENRNGARGFAHADEHYAPSRLGSANGGLNAALCPAALDRNVCTVDIADTLLAYCVSNALRQLLATLARRHQDGFVRAELFRHGEAMCAQVRHNYSRRPARLCHEQVHQSDRSSARDEDCHTSLYATSRASVKRYRQRLEQRGLIKAHIWRQLVAKCGRMVVVVAQRTVHWWGGAE
mmetsp:Transcript_2803/g.7717  ORF Transcript_2803/g.7717 Transcript_2803/m.7717 type:complete len:215 (+) Transcript_2803:139-783(+)